MGLGTRIIKIPIFLAFVILLVLAFLLDFEFSETAFAPFINAGDSEVSEVEVIASNAPETPDTGTLSVAYEPPVTEPVTEPFEMDNAVADDFITVRMSDSDIFTGCLLLINSEHNHEIPEDHGFIAIADTKTQSYRVTRDNMLLPDFVISSLNDMMDAFCEETGSTGMTIVSAYRDYERQQEALNDYIALVGYNEALRWAALPGHSEHQAGLAVDFGIYSGGALRTFRGAGDYAWILYNSYRYGFILRYPADKTDITGTAYEPWHFRYVGEPHAYIIYHNNWCFEEYIELLTEYSFEEPYRTSYNDEEYEVYYVGGAEIPIPFGCEFDISGNNIDGFIVTVRY